jgi:hypothetical protein
MKRDLSPSGKRRVSGYRDKAIDQFESNLIQDALFDNVREDDQLRYAADVAERAYSLADYRDSAVGLDDVHDDIFAGAEELNEAADARFEEVVGEQCVTIIENVRDWQDDRPDLDDEVIQEAVDEAQEWLNEHDDVADRLDLDVDQLGSEVVEA